MTKKTLKVLVKNESKKCHVGVSDIISSYKELKIKDSIFNRYLDEIEKEIIDEEITMGS